MSISKKRKSEQISSFCFYTLFYEKFFANERPLNAVPIRSPIERFLFWMLFAWNTFSLQKINLSTSRMARMPDSLA